MAREILLSFLLHGHIRKSHLHRIFIDEICHNPGCLLEHLPAAIRQEEKAQQDKDDQAFLYSKPLVKCSVSKLPMFFITFFNS